MYHSRQGDDNEPILDYEGALRISGHICVPKDQYLPLAKFADNNSYNSSIQMAPFEAFYGKGVMRFGKKGKLSPKFIGPFEILERIRDLANQLALPPILSVVYLVFMSLCFGSMYPMSPM
ncbi:hypothetical protein MTR67_035362 [Solanum verrucosum]|uniref:Tf2-1-like SH3-like domain-containing protein n=1 Tax=Solanum verrucosum TaxID=315347 RepID=A0AAF0U9T5_SOLVR|nr:hypothetical protein MTR67_035362 [Solanum verrucosum]